MTIELSKSQLFHRRVMDMLITTPLYRDLPDEQRGMVEAIILEYMETRRGLHAYDRMMAKRRQALNAKRNAKVEDQAG